MQRSNSFSLIWTTTHYYNTSLWNHRFSLLQPQFFLIEFFWTWIRICLGTWLMFVSFLYLTRMRCGNTKIDDISTHHRSYQDVKGYVASPTIDTNMVLPWHKGKSVHWPTYAFIIYPRKVPPFISFSHEDARQSILDMKKACGVT